MEGSYTICIKVNQEMEDTQKGIFANCGWDYDELVTRSQPVGNQPEPITKVRESPRNEGNMNELDQDPDHPIINPLAEYLCPHCFLAPCVTRRPNNFLGNGQAACVENSGLRKTFYRDYWKAINYLGGWTIPAYVRKTLTAGHGEWVLRHRREVMPYCSQASTDPIPKSTWEAVHGTQVGITTPWVCCEGPVYTVYIDSTG